VDVSSLHAWVLDQELQAQVLVNKFGPPSSELSPADPFLFVLRN
jgi:hypothetical protein